MVVAAAASMECLVRCPAPPAPSAVSISASSVSVASCRAATLPPSGGRSLISWALGEFFFPSPPHASVLPCWYRDAVGAPRVSSPLGPPCFLVFELYRDDSTPPPFYFGVKSSCHDSTPQPPPLEVESSWDNLTSLPSPWRFESSRPETIRPPAPLLGSPPPGFSSTPEASRPPSSPPTLWGSGSTPEASCPPEFHPTPKCSAISHLRRYQVLN